MSSESAGSDRGVPRAALAALRARVTGTVVTPADDEHAAVSAVWNRAAQCRPAVIVRCLRTDDVARAIEFARTVRLPLAVRAGGHSPAGMSSCDGVIIDLRPMHGVRVDPLGKVAVVAGGAMWAAVDAGTQRHGYAIPGVPVSRIGVAGSTLGGGFGHLRRAYGLACDNLVGAEMITADGRFVATSGDRHPELLWGLRGGGGNFGVVTSMRFRLRPLPDPLLSGPVLYEGGHAARLLRFYREYTAQLREDVTTRLSLLGAPPQALVGESPGSIRPVPVVGIAAACIGPPADSERLVRPLRSAAPVLLDRLTPQPYTRLQAGHDDTYRPGRYTALSSLYVDELEDRLVEALCESYAAMPAGSFELHLHHMGGAVGRVGRMSTAVPNRGARYLVTILARWDLPAEEPASRGWLDATEKRLRPYVVGGPNVGLHSEPASSVEAYGAERYLRLAALKRRYDPDNVFAGNQNVVPLA